VANRRQEERDRLRQVREEREGKHARESRRKLMIGYIAAGVIALAVVVGIVVAVTSSGGGGGGGGHVSPESGSTNGIALDEREGTAPPAVKVSSLKQAAKQAGCALRLHLKDEGHQHIPPGSPTPHYHTNPPTSGKHVEPPYQQADGSYSEMPAEIDFVHSLEHGRVEFQYSPQLPEKDQLTLKGLYDEMYGGTLLFPNTKMPYEVAATSWTNLIGCPQYRGSITLDAIRDFAKATWGRYGGENAFGVEGPTPVQVLR
jgi:uncharacterized protein DUF3105